MSEVMRRERRGVAGGLILIGIGVLLIWAWSVHFWQDVLIFSFLAVGAITAGG